MPQTSVLPHAIAKELAVFIETGKPGRLNRNLRWLLLNMLQAQPDGYLFDLDDLLYDLSMLHRLLDAIEDEGSQ